MRRIDQDHADDVVGVLRREPDEYAAQRSPDEHVGTGHIGSLQQVVQIGDHVGAGAEVARGR